MNIYIDIYEARNIEGVYGVGAKARIEFSPNDGYDANKLALLERELGQIVETKLNDALSPR